MTTHYRGGIIMNTAKPITDQDIITDLMEVYDVGSKNHLILAYALNTGLRVSDMLNAKAGQAKRGYWEGTEQKTGKTKHQEFSDSLRLLIIEYVEENDLHDSDYLFYNERDRSKSISRQAVDKVIRHAGDMIGLTLSAHSLRKTFGYMAYKSKQYDIADLQYIFNHSSPKTTLRYIGVTQEAINRKNRGFTIGL